jgi:hypothetical protein
MGKPTRITGNHVRKIFLIALLTIIPAIILLTSLETIKTRNKAWYDGGYDPEYAYLFNALNMARFRLAGHIDHPGTTMQVAGGIVLQGAWMFDPRDENLTKAVLSDPEHYIRILNIATAIMGSLAIFIIALLLFSKIQNIWYALIFQLTPFISGFILYNGFTRVTQEMMLLAAAMAMAAISIYWHLRKDETGKNGFILLFGIVSGFGMASKILFAPLMIIPLILLEPFTSKKKYIITTLVSFVVFTLPVIRLYPNIAYWIFRLFFHTGRYGSGDIGIVNTSSYFGDLVSLFRISPLFFIIFLVSILLLIAFRFHKIFEKNRPYPIVAKLLLAVVLAEAAGYLLVAKQPKEAYLLPYECLAAVNVIVIFHLMVSLLPGKVSGGMLTAVFTLLLSVVVIPYGLVRKSKIYATDRNDKWENAWLTATSFTGKEAKIFAQPGSSPIAGLYFGNVYSLRRYDLKLKELYPDFYIFDCTTKEIHNWGEKSVSLENLFRKYDGRICFCGPIDETFPGLPALKIPGWKMKQVWKDEKQFISTPVKDDYSDKPETRKLLFCPVEAISEYDKSIFFTRTTGIGELSFEASFSGNSSIITNKNNPSAFDLQPVTVMPGERIEVSVWASGNPDDLEIVAEIGNSDTRITGSVNDQAIKRNGWILLKLNINGTEELAGKEIRISVRNTGQNKAWFDDFRMEILNPYFSYSKTNEPIIRK